MAESTPETLNHFAVASFTPAFHQLPVPERRKRLGAWLDAVARNADALHLYQLAGFEASGDLLVWSGCRSAEPERVGRFFGGFGAALGCMRGLVELRDVLWGFTRPSPYTKTRSTQELDPFTPGRRPFLVVYPFVKTAEWYRLDREARQKMMADHIRIGTQYRDITQLLLYSFGLQDQEFVVVYETDDLRRFSALVQELRSTEARIYTERDAPLHTAIFQPDREVLSAWL